ncbi:MAG TPA: sigma-70 family RNA polymerase sigma factor [Streptosporangiaceae bacterium]|nr:sigma-70 family RNA polymerase sigma factor [Streptosporangiaceae bacterium]
MRDSEIVAAVVGGDPAGLAAAYDRYAGPLYAYCRSLLTEPADASDAVQDTFIIASSKLAGLRDRERLRPWLYAVARNECHRRLRARAKDVSLDEAGDVTDDTPEAATSTERAELRQLVLAAVNGLNPGDRELIELNLRHELEGADLADALGVPLNQAHALASRARSQFSASLGALLVARSGREYCAELDSLLAGWDGQLTVLMRKRLNRHIERCEVCGDRKRRELQPAMLLSLLPVVMLPANLRGQVLRLVADQGPAPTSYRAYMARQAEPFRRSGFPVPLDPPKLTQRRRRAAAATSVAAAIMLLAAMVVFKPFQGGAPLVAASRHLHSAGTHLDLASASPSPTQTATPRERRHTRSSPSAAPTTQSPPTTPASNPPPPTQRPTPSPSHSTPPPPPQGTLSETPGTVDLAWPPTGGPPSGTFTLTASGGTVNYTVSVLPGDAANGLSVSPASGSLADGQSVTITVTWTGGSALSTAVTVSPGGLSVGISWQPIT